MLPCYRLATDESGHFVQLCVKRDNKPEAELRGAAPRFIVTLDTVSCRTAAIISVRAVEKDKLNSEI